MNNKNDDRKSERLDINKSFVNFIKKQIYENKIISFITVIISTIFANLISTKLQNEFDFTLAIIITIIMLVVVVIFIIVIYFIAYLILKYERYKNKTKITLKFRKNIKSIRFKGPNKGQCFRTHSGKLNPIQVHTFESETFAITSATTPKGKQIDIKSHLKKCVFVDNDENKNTRSFIQGLCEYRPYSIKKWCFYLNKSNKTESVELIQIRTLICRYDNEEFIVDVSGSILFEKRKLNINIPIYVLHPNSFWYMDIEKAKSYGLIPVVRDATQPVKSVSAGDDAFDIERFFNFIWYRKHSYKGSFAYLENSVYIARDIWIVLE